MDKKGLIRIFESFKGIQTYIRLGGQFFEELDISNLAIFNLTACFKYANNCLNTSIDSYFKTSGGQKSNIYLHIV